MVELVCSTEVCWGTTSVHLWWAWRCIYSKGVHIWICYMFTPTGFGQIRIHDTSSGVELVCLTDVRCVASSVCVRWAWKCTYSKILHIEMYSLFTPSRLYWKRICETVLASQVALFSGNELWHWFVMRLMSLKVVNTFRAYFHGTNPSLQSWDPIKTACVRQFRLIHKSVPKQFECCLHPNC